MKPPRLFIFRCQCLTFNDRGEEMFFHFAYKPSGRGPRPYADNMVCHHEPGCDGPIEFVGVYVPEGSAPPHAAKAGKRKARPA